MGVNVWGESPWVVVVGGGESAGLVDVRGVGATVWGVKVVCVWVWCGWGFVISVFGWSCGMYFCGGFLVWGAFSQDV